MIVFCPHCGRLVTSDEWLVLTPSGWTPTLCVNGDGPSASGGEIVRNHPHWYVTARDGRRCAVLAGPFTSYDQAELVQPEATRRAWDADRHGPWLAYGVAGSSQMVSRVAFPDLDAEDSTL